MESNGAGAYKKPESNITVEIIEYVPSRTMKRTVMKKTNGHISITSVVIGEDLGSRLFEVDTFLQVVEGIAWVSINGKVYELRLGEGILIPANAKHFFYSNGRYKVISTSVKTE